jgi:hypothetical protein
MLTAPLVLARQFRADPQWAMIARPVQVLALISAAAMAVFASRAAEPATAPCSGPRSRSPWLLRLLPPPGC